MEPLTGISIGKTCTLSRHWHKACSIWVDTVQKICKNFDYTDSPWEYLERTNSAIFAGALTAGGVPSMPETYVMRDRITEQGEQRVDICSVDSGKKKR